MLDGRRNPPAVAAALLPVLLLLALLLPLALLLALLLLLPLPSEEEGFPEFWLILFSIVFLYK
jgi:hypothetical protein